MVVIIIILSVRVLDDARASHFCCPDQRRHLGYVYGFTSISISVEVEGLLIHFNLFINLNS
jgi:hypothetical protein